MTAKIIKINESIVDYFFEEMDLQNESKEFRTIKTEEFKDNILKALDSASVSNVEVTWVKNN